MSLVPKPPDVGKCALPTLRECLRPPRLYLLLLALAIAMGTLDTLRVPKEQILAAGYIVSVGCYQAIGRPLLEGRIACRYHPTCSEYSIQAVRKHGLRAGLFLTLARIRSCTRIIRPGTFDPVP